MMINDIAEEAADKFFNSLMESHGYVSRNDLKSAFKSACEKAVRNVWPKSKEEDLVLESFINQNQRS